jgi:hypothetical protein
VGRLGPSTLVPEKKSEKKNEKKMNPSTAWVLCVKIYTVTKKRPQKLVVVSPYDGTTIMTLVRCKFHWNFGIPSLGIPWNTRE